MHLLLIGIGGFLGAIGRYGVSRLINSFFPMGLVPWGTIMVNVTGAFLLAFLMTANYYKFQLQPYMIFFIGIGFLGAFTTFSTFTYETLSLFEESHIRGILYVAITLIAGYGSAYLGYIAGRGTA